MVGDKNNNKTKKLLVEIKAYLKPSWVLASTNKTQLGFLPLPTILTHTEIGQTKQFEKRSWYTVMINRQSAKVNKSPTNSAVKIRGSHLPVVGGGALVSRVH